MTNPLTVAAAHLAPVYMDPGRTAAKAAEWIGRAGAGIPQRVERRLHIGGERGAGERHAF